MFSRYKPKHTITYEIVINNKQDDRYSFINKEEALVVAKRLSKDFNKVEVKKVELVYFHVGRKT